MPRMENEWEEPSLLDPKVAFPHRTLKSTLEPANWPNYWLWEARSVQTPNGPQLQHFVGDGVRVEKNGDLTYTCPKCPLATWRRAPGFLNEETRLWILEHTPHLEPK